MSRISWRASARSALALAAFLAAAAPLRAQQPPPAGAAGSSQPADSAGTIIVGDKESPMGLYLTPWKNVHPDRNLDRPPQLLQEELTPVDPKVFRRRVYYYDNLAEQRKLDTGGK